MAIGLKTDVRRGRWFKRGVFAQAAANTSSGWQMLEGIHPFSVTVSGDFSATSVVVTIYVDSGDTAPTDADANHATLKVFTITAPQAAPPAFSTDAPYEWIKAVYTSYSGTATVTTTLEAYEADSKY